MLRDDVAEQRPLQRVALALKRPEAVSAAVGVLGGVGDEASLGQLGRERLVITEAVSGGGDRVHRDTLEPMLADDHRPFLAGLDVLGHQQDARGDHVGIDVDHGFIGTVGVGIEHLSCADVGRDARLLQPPDHLVVDQVAVGLDRVGPGLEIRAVGAFPERVADLGTASQQCLGEGDQLADLLPLSA